jgi:hypothetical protein
MTATETETQQPTIVPVCSPSKEYILRQNRLSDLTYRLSEENRISREEALMLYRAAESEWDDALHIAAPWDRRVSLCGNWGRNLCELGGTRPDGLQGCWTCLQTAEWLDAHLAIEVPQ